jgi:hypothetical protein
MTEPQTTADVLMIRPASFCANPQTAGSNFFQTISVGQLDTATRARSEFDAVVQALRQGGVRVHVFDDLPEPATPDAIFPNNWVSFHADGTVVLYPMLAENRRLERRIDILESLVRDLGFRATRTIDMTHRESVDQFLEGTGSLVLDRRNHVAYACLSSRTHLDALREFSQLLDYEVIAFEAVDRKENPIYHTNVMLSIGERFAAVCADAIRSDQRQSVVDALRSTGHEIVELTTEQMHLFAGNILQVATLHGDRILVMSEQARASFTHMQQEQLREYAGPIVSAAIPTIETLGGGSVRCMLAEIFLPRR